MKFNMQYLPLLTVLFTVFLTACVQPQNAPEETTVSVIQSSETIPYRQSLAVGAMENIAAVTFSENYAQRKASDRFEREARASVILHEYE